MFPVRRSSRCRKLVIEVYVSDDEVDGAKGHESISQPEELFKLMSAELNDMITTMRDQLMGNDGIITVHGICTSEVVTGLEKASDIITDAEDELAEDELAEAFGFLRASLTDHYSGLRGILRGMILHEAQSIKINQGLHLLSFFIESVRDPRPPLLPSSYLRV